MAAPLFYNQGDQNIYKDFQYVPQEKYRLGFTAPTTTPTAAPVSGGITNTNAFTNSGGGNNYFAGSPNSLIQDYNTTTKDRYFRNQDTPLVDGLYQSKLDKTFMGMPSYRQQELTGADLGQYIGTNTDVPLEQTMAGKIQSGLGNFKNKTGNFMGNIKGFGPVSMALNAMDRFDTLSPTDQQFINMNMGYTGPTVFGENNSGLSKDPFGINTRSLFGNYADYVEDYNTDYTEEELAEFSKVKQQKIAFYMEKKKELNAIKEKEKAKFQAEKDRLAGLVGTRGTDPNTGTTSTIQGESGGNTAGTSRASDHGKAAGLGHNAGNVRGANAAGTGSAQGYNQNLRSGGRVGYFFGGRVNFKNGGLASIL